MTTDIGDDSAGPNEADGIEASSRLQAENAALRSGLSEGTALRRWLTVLLVILTSLAVVAATVAVWAHERVFDTDAFMDTVEPALDDPAFYAAIGTQVSTQTLEALDIETRVTDALTQLDAFISQALLDALDVGEQGRALLGRFERPSLASLAPAITAGLESRVTSIVDRFVTSEQFTSRFPELVRRLHEATIALLRDELADLPNVSIAEGEVRLDLLPTVAEALRQVAGELRGLGPDITLPDAISTRASEARAQLAEALQAELPDDFGQVTVMSEERLGEVQDAVDRMDRFVWVLVILAVVLAGLTVAVSPTRRRTLLQLALGVVAGLVISLAIMRRLQEAVVGQITNPDGDQAARALFGEITSSLRTAALVVGLAAIVVAVAAHLAGRPAWLSGLDEPAPGNEAGHWVTSHHDLLRIAGLGVGVGILFIVGIELIPVIVIAVVLALYLWGLAEVRRRTTAADSADAATEGDVAPRPGEHHERQSTAP